MSFAGEAIAQLIPLAEKEAHDQTTDTFLQAISVFLQKLPSFPPALEKFSKAGLSSDKAPVRKSHLICLLNGLSDATIPQVFPLVDTVLDSVKKVSPQTLAQVISHEPPSLVKSAQIHFFSSPHFLLFL